MSDNASFYRDTVDRLLTDSLSLQVMEASERRELPAAMFDALVENGITLMLVPEDQGGVDATLPEALAVARAVGAQAAPGPVIDAMLANRFLALAGLEPVSGPAALAFAGQAERPAGDAWASAPVLRDVPWGGLAQAVVVVGQDAAGAYVARTAPDGWAVEAGADAAGEPRDTLTARNATAQVGALAGNDAYAEALRTASILRAGQLLGAVEWSLRRTVEYAMERKQFGREIGKFQAVQQALAELADHVLAATAITQAAAEAGSDVLVAAARSRLADAADAAIAVGHQVHGAMGFSREYPLNFRTRRMMAWRDDFGSVLTWRRRLAGQFTGLSLEAFWPAVADAGLRRVG